MPWTPGLAIFIGKLTHQNLLAYTKQNFLDARFIMNTAVPRCVETTGNCKHSELAIQNLRLVLFRNLWALGVGGVFQGCRTWQEVIGR